MAKRQNPSQNPYALPAVGIYFKVRILLRNKPWIMLPCRSVSGLGVETKVCAREQKTFRSLFTQGLQYSDIVLQKALISTKEGAPDKELFNYMRDRANDSQASKLDLIVYQLRPDGKVDRSWRFQRAVLANWRLEGFNAERSELLVTTLQFKISNLVFE